MSLAPAAGDAAIAADALLRGGDLAGARHLLAEELRAHPGNFGARQFFWPLLALTGEWDKAEAQLRTLAGVQSSAMMLASVYGQAITAERARERTMAGEIAPRSLVGSEPWVDALLDALAATTRGDADAALRREAALEIAPASAGTLDGEQFAWVADADPRFGPMLEVIIGADYGFIPFAAIRLIKATPVTELRDTVWRPVEITLAVGQSSLAFVPSRYPGSASASDPALVLGRATAWVAAADGAETGLGQRLLATDQDDQPIGQPFDIRFD